MWRVFNTTIWKNVAKISTLNMILNHFNLQYKTHIEWVLEGGCHMYTCFLEETRLALAA